MKWKKSKYFECGWYFCIEKWHQRLAIAILRTVWHSLRVCRICISYAIAGAAAVKCLRLFLFFLCCSVQIFSAASTPLTLALFGLHSPLPFPIVPQIRDIFMPLHIHCNGSCALFRARHYIHYVILDVFVVYWMPTSKWNEVYNPHNEERERGGER